MEVETVRVGEKGQITIPIDFRDKENIKKGELLEVVYLGDGQILLTKANKKQEFLVAMKVFGKGLKNANYDNDEKIIKLCREIRKEVYDESISRH